MNKAPLSTIAEVIRGVSFSKDEGSAFPSERRLPVIRAGSIQESLLLDEGQIWVPEEKVKESQKIRRDDIVMCTSSGSSSLVGKCAKAEVDFDGSFGAFCAGIRPNKDRVSASYLYHFLSSPAFRNWTSSSSGANIKNIRVSELAGFEIPLPPLEEQKRIATILDKADAIRHKRQQAIQLADEFLRAVFLDMFGDPVTNPKGWEVKLLGQLIKEGPSNGLYKPSSEYGSGARILRIDGFYSGVLAPQEKLKRVKLEPKEVAKYQLKDRSIVINRVNSREYLGKSAFIQELDEITVFESNMMNFSVLEDLVNPYFLVQQFQTPFIKNQILKLAKDAVNQSSINQQDVKSLEVLVPELSLQRKFEQVCRRYSESLVKYEHGLTEIGNMFGSLSQKAFKGEL